MDRGFIFWHTGFRAERWLSGRKRHPAKVLCSLPGTMGSNPILSAIFCFAMRISGILSFALALLLVFSGCSFGSSSSSSSGEKTDSGYITPEYTIAVPAAWEIYPKEEYPASILFAARQNVYTHRVPASVSISTTASKPSSIDQFVAKNLESVRKVSQDIQVLSTADVSDSSADKILVEYSERSSKDFSRIGFLSLYVVPKTVEQSYVITMLFDEATTADEKEELQKIILSFTLKQ